MRWHSVLLATLVLLPSASAASQVHVAYTGDAYSLTFVSNATSDVPVRYHDQVVLATRVLAPSGDNDRIFRARLPASTLTYEVEGEQYSLRAPPSPDASTRIAFVADVGLGSNATAVLAAIERADPDLVIIGGDLAYAHGNASVWNQWLASIESLAARRPVMPVYGNHEDYCVGENGSFYSCGPDRNGWHAHFELANKDALYYVLDWGPLRIVALDTEAYESVDSYTDDKAQEAFLAGAFAADNGTWNLATFHRPLRTTNAKDGIASENARDALWPLLDGRADLVLQGHAHAYERAKPENGTVYLTSGGGGRSLYDEWLPIEPWVETRAAEHHFLLIEANRTTLRVQAIRLDGSTLDEFKVERPAPPMPTPTAAPPSPTPSTSTPLTPPQPGNATNTTNASGNVSESNEAPGVSAALLVAAIMLLARRSTPRAPR